MSKAKAKPTQKKGRLPGPKTKSKPKIKPRPKSRASKPAAKAETQTPKAEPPVADDGLRHCPNCNATDIVADMRTDLFLYGVEPNQVELEARVLAFTCKECGESYTGEQAEKARADAVEAYLNPKTIPSIEDVFL